IFSLRNAPVTWMLFFVNLMVMVMTFPQAEKSQKELQSYLRDRAFTSLQGKYFAEYVRSNSDRYPATIRYLAEAGPATVDPARVHLLGGIAMRDNLFLAEAPELEFRGDKVSMSWWKENLEKVQSTKENHPSYMLGLTSDHYGWLECLSYQFAHAGIGHFIGNMVFLLIFASNI